MVLLLILVVLALALLLVFCTRNTPLRVAPNALPAPPAVTSIRELEESEASRDQSSGMKRMNSCSEFDDQGWLWSLGKLDQVLEQICRVLGEGRKRSTGRSCPLEGRRCPIWPRSG